MTNSVLSKMSISVWNENVKDIRDAWPVYIIMFIITIFVCIIFYFLLEHCTTIMIFIMVSGAIIGLVILGVVNWRKYQSVLAESTLKADEAKEFKIIAIICWVFAGIFLIAVCCLF